MDRRMIRDSVLPLVGNPIVRFQKQSSGIYLIIKFNVEASTNLSQIDPSNQQQRTRTLQTQQSFNPETDCIKKERSPTFTSSIIFNQGATDSGTLQGPTRKKNQGLLKLA